MDVRKRKCERDPRPRSLARRPTLTLFREPSFQTDADVMSRAGVLAGLRARTCSRVENYYLLYAGRARAKSDLAKDAGIILMSHDGQRAH